ncbi:MAG: hybrid sensor histidine kinase/response regulator [Rhizobacter sp.]|nr:hybrid sensor histidine kinase/response regulator [Rhizobacter sp.]
MASWWPLIPDAVEPEQLARLLLVSPMVSVLSAVGAVVSCVLYFNGPVDRELIVWLALFGSMSLARVLAGLYAPRARSLQTHPRRWARWGLGSTLVHGLQWGLLSVVLRVPGNPEAESILHITLAAVAMGSAVHLSGFYRVLVVFVVCVLGPLVLRDLLVGTAYHAVMAGMIFLIGVYTLLNGRNQAKLIQALHQENQRSEAARRAAEEASAARTRFFAAANHDLRQPLHAMGLLAQTLCAPGSKAAPVDVAEVSGHLVECVEGMTNVVDDLLEITRLDVGHMTPQSSVFGLDDLLRETCQPYQALARAKGLQLAVDAGRLAVRSDRALVARVLANLVSNAIRYTRAGAVRIYARPDGDQVVLRVEDTGIGIASDHLPRIFEEFYQVGNPARDRRLGLGLGLATVKRLSDLLSLSVSVQSAPAQGSVFTLTLPRAPDHELAPMPPGGTPAVEPLIASQRVLLIEDDADSRNALLGLLLQWGCDARAAPGAREAIAWLGQGFTPDVLVVDLRLADGASGLDVIDSLRAAVGHELPALVVTGDAGSEHMLKAQSRGFAVLVKPARPVQLRAFLSQAFSAP